MNWNDVSRSARLEDGEVVGVGEGVDDFDLADARGRATGVDAGGDDEPGRNARADEAGRDGDATRDPTVYGVSREDVAEIDGGDGGGEAELIDGVGEGAEAVARGGFEV